MDSHHRPAKKCKDEQIAHLASFHKQIGEDKRRGEEKEPSDELVLCNPTDELSPKASDRWMEIDQEEQSVQAANQEGCRLALKEGSSQGVDSQQRHHDER